MLPEQQEHPLVTKIKNVGEAGCILLFLAVSAIIAFGFMIEMRAIIVGTAIILVAGIGLFLLRRTHRTWYGVVEIVSGVALGAYSIAQLTRFNTQTTFGDSISSTDGLATLLGLMSSAYILVRGMDNIEEGRKRKKIDPDVQH